MKVNNQERKMVMAVGENHPVLMTDLVTGIYGHTLPFRLLFTQMTTRAVWKMTETAAIHI